MDFPDMFSCGDPNLGSSHDVLVFRPPCQDIEGSDHLLKYNNGLDCEKLIPYKRKPPMFVERERRIFMNNRLMQLQALLPHSVPKRNKLTILNATLKYIPLLQMRVEELRKIRASLVVAGDEIKTIQTGVVPQDNGVDIKVHHNQVIITISNPRNSKPLSAILELIQSHGLDVIHGGVFKSNLINVQYFHTMGYDSSSTSLDSLQRRLQMLVS